MRDDDDAGGVLARALAEAFDLPDPHASDGPVGQPPPERYTRRGLSLRPGSPMDEDAIDLDELEHVLMDAATQYLSTPDPGYALLMAAPAGSGKTRLAVRLAEQLASESHHVLYCGPRRAFFADTQALATQPAWWYAWQPRQAGTLETTPPQPQTCRWTPQIEAWMTRGYDALDFCTNRRICGWNYITGKKCAYHNQKERTEPIIFGQHAHAALGHPLMERMYLVIGDELPLSAFLHRWTIPASAIVPPNMPAGPLETLLRNLRWLCSQTPEDDTVWRGNALYAALPGRAAGVVQALAGSTIPLDAIAVTPKLRDAGAVDDAPFFHLPRLLHLLQREATRAAAGETVIPRILLGADGLTLLLRRPPANLPAHLIWLDATGDAALYERLFRRPMRLVRPQARLTGRVYQVWASTNNKAAVVDRRTDADGAARSAAKLATLRAQLARICTTRGYTRPALISYKAAVADLLPALPPTAPRTHFGAARGTNALQECDVLFVVGAPMPPRAALEETAAQLFFERDDPFRTTWSAIDVPFVGADAAHSVGGYWDDPDLTLLLRQVREGEIVQAVHRARPLRRDVDVWLLTNVVTDLPVGIVSLHELFDAHDADGRPLTGIDPYRWPDVLALPATMDDPLTTARLMDAFGISRPTASKWYEAAKTTGRYTEITVGDTPQRGRPARGLVKRFDDPI